MVRAVFGTDAPKLKICGSGLLLNHVRQVARHNPFIEYEGGVHGTRKELLLQNCRTVIAPSLCYEPLGLVTFEAYDYLKPVLASNIGGFSETVIHGHTGLLHTPGEARELANHISLQECNPDTLPTMGQNGKNWLQQNASPEVWLDQFNGVLDRVIQLRNV